MLWQAINFAHTHQKLHWAVKKKRENNNNNTEKIFEMEINWSENWKFLCNSFSLCVFFWFQFEILLKARAIFIEVTALRWDLIEIEFTLTDALIACWCFHKEEEKNSFVKFIIIFGWILQLIVCAFFSVYKFISDSFTLKKQDWINLRLVINIQTIRN